MNVYKYTIPVTDYFDLCLPQSAKVLSFQCQHDLPVMWALVDADKPKERRYFRLAGTGHGVDFTNSMSYIGTAQMGNGALVWHLFEILE